MKRRSISFINFRQAFSIADFVYDFILDCEKREYYSEVWHSMHSVHVMHVAFVQRSVSANEWPPFKRPRVYLQITQAERFKSALCKANFDDNYRLIDHQWLMLSFRNVYI